MSDQNRRTALASIGALGLIGTATRSLATNGTDDVSGTFAPTEETDWPTRRGNPARTGSTIEEASPNGEYADLARRAEDAYVDGMDEAIVAEGLVFRASLISWSTFQGTIAAFDAETGEKAWSHENPSWDDATEDNKGIGYIRSEPAVGDGRLYVTSDSNYDIFGGLHALDIETGETVWKRPDMGRENLAFVDGVLCTEQNGLDPATGEVLWTVSDESHLGYNDGLRYGVTDSEIVTRSIQDGTVEQSLTTDAGPNHRNSAIANDTVYWESNEVVAMSLSDGTVQWRWPPDDTSMTVHGYPAVSDETVFVTGTIPVDGNPYAEEYPRGHRSTVYALDAASGEVKWTYDTSTRLRGVPTIAGDTAYVGGHAFGKKEKDVEGPTITRRYPTVHALSTDDGTEQWSYLLRNRWSTTITWAMTPVVANGHVYAKITEDRMEPGVGLYALEASNTATDAWNLPTDSDAPLARITTDPENAEYIDLNGGITVTLDGSESSGEIEAYGWRLGDGGSFDTTGQTISVTMDFCGSLQVTLRVAGPDGEQSTASITLATTQ